MSKKKKIEAVRRQSEAEELIEESFNEAVRNGTLTDILGNPVDPKEMQVVDPEWGKADFVTGTVFPQMKYLQGRVLTIVDATYEDKERAKYIKDIIKDAFVSQADSIMQMLINSETK